MSIDNFFIHIGENGKICGLRWWVSLCWISKVPDMKSSVTIILSKLCYQKLLIMIIIYEDTISSLAYAICASVINLILTNFFLVGLDCEDVESGACFLVRDRPYLCYNENNKEQCCSTCQQLFTDIEGGTISLLTFFLTVLLVSIQHLPVNRAFIWLENVNLIVLFSYNLLVNKISEVSVVSARSLPFFSLHQAHDE